MPAAFRALPLRITRSSPRVQRRLPRHRSVLDSGDRMTSITRTPVRCRAGAGWTLEGIDGRAENRS